jgi:hypothetical protein
MSSSRAAELWNEFMALFGDQDVNFATNVSLHENSWNPATRSTFDMGIFVFGIKKVGCLWIEEEE